MNIALINNSTTSLKVGFIQLLCSQIVATVLGILLMPYFAHQNVGMIYLLSVVFVATRNGWFLSTICAFMSLLSYIYFVMPPAFEFFPIEPQSTITFGTMSVIAIVISRRSELMGHLAHNLEFKVTRRTDELQIANMIENELTLHKTLDELTSKNAALERFARVAISDLREPLRTIIAYTKMLKRRSLDSLPEDIFEFINKINAGVERLERLMDGTGSLIRVNGSTEHLTSVDAHELLSEAIANLNCEIEERNAQIDLGNDLSNKIIFCDRTQLIRVFQNLISNSLKFCRQKPHIKIECHSLGDKYVFSVRDNGIGIEEKYQEHLFNIYHSLNNRRKFPGDGIGLALCKQIIKNHNGIIWLESQPKAGTTFFFSIPIGV